MSASGDDPKSTQQPPNQSTVLLLLGTIADTTWRMFVPTLGGTGLGLWLDQMASTAPWCAIGGLTIGIAVTVVLMKRQFQKLKEEA